MTPNQSNGIGCRFVVAVGMWLLHGDCSDNGTVTEFCRVRLGPTHDTASSHMDNNIQGQSVLALHHRVTALRENVNLRSTEASAGESSVVAALQGEYFPDPRDYNNN